METAVQFLMRADLIEAGELPSTILMNRVLEARWLRTMARKRIEVEARSLAALRRLN